MLRHPGAMLQVTHAYDLANDEKSQPPPPHADKPSKCHATSIINNTIGIHMK